LAFELPAATTVVTPAVTRFATAVFTDELLPPPRLMFATAGFAAFFATQSMPAMTPVQEPEPSQFSTRTGTSLEPLAMP